MRDIVLRIIAKYKNSTVKGPLLRPLCYLCIKVLIAAAGRAVAAEYRRESAVLPHCVYERYEYGRAASAEHGIEPVAAAARGYEQKYKYPKAAVGTAAAA